MGQETEIKKKKKLSDIIVDNLQKVTIVLISTVYIFQGVFALTKKNTSIIDILGSVGMSIIVGMVLTSSFVSMGLKDGKKSNDYQLSLKAYASTKVEATPDLDKLFAWCEYKNAQELESRKKDIIQGAGMNWKAYKFGYYNEHTERLNETQIKALEDAKKCSIVKLSSQELLSDLPNKNERKFSIFKINSRFGETESEYQRRISIKDAFIKVFIALVLGLYTLTPLITEENFLDVLSGVTWNMMQVIIWLTFGVTKYFNSKSFIENEYRQTHIIQKTEYLNEFIATIKNNPKVIESYEEDLEIDKYINEFINEKRQKGENDE